MSSNPKLVTLVMTEDEYKRLDEFLRTALWAAGKLAVSRQRGELSFYACETDRLIALDDEDGSLLEMWERSRKPT